MTGWTTAQRRDGKYDRPQGTSLDETEINERFCDLELASSSLSEGVEAKV